MGSLLFVGVARAQWVAFNDHVPGAIGTQTHSNASTLKIPALGGPISTNVLLRDISSGTNLNVTLTVARSADGVLNQSSASVPASGTPLYNTFNGFVYFGLVSGDTPNIDLTTGSVTYTFTGLNPTRLYSFKGGAVRGNSVQTNKWTLVELQGANSFIDVHSANVITHANVATLATNQVAVTFGRNNTTGDMVDWESIDPGADGTISIVCSHYTGAVTNGGSSSGTNGFAITGIRLEEMITGPPVILTQPTNATLFAGETYSFLATAGGSPPLSYQWYKNNALIDGATSSNYSATAVYPDDNNAQFYVAVSNSSGSATSSNATLTVSNSAPILLSQPQDQTVNAPVTAAFSVTATGSKPLFYQWYRQGSMIAGATNASYTTPSTSINDSGARFSVRVFNSVGTRQSSNATLTVIVPPLTVLPYAKVWRYFTNGTDLGTAWRATQYDDSTWAQGPGWLGVEDNPSITAYMNTFFPGLNDAQGNRIITWYFRTHFNLASDPNSVLLVSSNYIDDGAVFYVNGQEFTRTNLPAPPAQIGYQTLALSSAIEGVSSIFTNVIPASMLVQGDNVLAVEVHQVNTTSADIVFGMGLTAFFPPPTALAITSNPSDRTVSESAATTFTVGFTGAPVSFQWYKWIDGSPVTVAGGTKQSLILSNVSLADAGYYFVVVSNNINAVASTAAQLIVVRDQSGPKLISADGTSNQTQITLSFSEPVWPSTATNPENYFLTNVTSGGMLAVSAAVLQGGTNVILTSSAARSLADNWLLIVNNVRDTSPQQNLVPANSAIPVSSQLTLIGLTEPGWDFYDPVGPPIDNYEPPPNWKEIDFQVPDDDWGHDAAGLFAYNPNQQPLPAPVKTTLSGGAISSYYRFPFQVDFSPVGATFSLRQIIDDGIVTYFNGAEIYRSNMPTGAVNALTPARQDRPAFDTGPIALPDVFAFFGTNVLATELHGASTSDQNLAFGAELTAQILSWARGPVLITSGPDDVTVEEGSSALFRFVGVGASGFQWQTNSAALPGANLSVLRVDSVPLLWNGLFVRVLASNDTSIAVSTNARLHVIPDLTPPALLGAVAQSNGILLTFSEPLLSESATNLSNYALSNGMASSVTLLGVTMVTPSKVLLIIGSSSNIAYQVVVNGVRDAATAQNEIAANTRATVGFDFSIPIDSVWRFFTNNVDLGTAWRAASYNDSAAPWATGPALIAEEDCACLPEPIRTPISRLDNGTYHYTFYFRYHWYLPFAPPSASVTFRHVIDDGAVMYINGQEFYRFNMAGPVDYTTQASANVGNAIYTGPFSATFTNLIAGDNVIAVEVHQNGTASPDVTFGAEFFGNVASMIVPGELGEAPARLQITRQDGNIIVSWSGSGLILEASDLLGSGANWQPVQNQINPYFTSASASTQRFYRLSR